MNFVSFATQTGKSINDFLQHVKKMDTTHGAPPEQQIVMASIFRTKGLEFDYVFLPNCDDGYLPYLFGCGNYIYDTARIYPDPEPSELLENEQRLFYVGLTRARKVCYIGTTSGQVQKVGDKQESTLPSRFIDEMQPQATLDLMNALQRMAAGDLKDKVEFLHYASENRGRSNLLKSVMEGYLLRMEDGVLYSQVVRMLNSSPEIPFRYRFVHETPKTKREEPTLHSAWDDAN